MRRESILVYVSLYTAHTAEDIIILCHWIYVLNQCPASLGQAAHPFIWLAQCNLPAGWHKVTVLMHQSTCVHGEEWLTPHKDYRYRHRFVLGWSICRKGTDPGRDPSTLRLSTAGHTPCALWLLNTYTWKKRQWKTSELHSYRTQMHFDDSVQMQKIIPK